MSRSMLVQEPTDFQLDHYLSDKDDDGIIKADLNLSNITYDTLPLSHQDATSEGCNNTSIDSSSLQQVAVLRKSFEQTSQSPTNFTYGESFRQRQHQDKLGEKTNQKMAKDAIRGFSEIKEEAAVGFIDCSPLSKKFAFEATKEKTALQDESFDIQYEESKYRTAVFVVHHTNGMLLLQHNRDGSNQMAEIPGGSITETEITKAACKSSHFKMQLQFAGREEAARYLYEQTGMDVRGSVERLQPAVLHFEPPIGNDGLYLLRNEVNESLFYLLQIDPTEDYYDKAIQSCTEPDSVTYIRQPAMALDILEYQGGCNSALALEMIIRESATSPAPKTLEDHMSVSESHLLAKDLPDNEPAPEKKKKMSLIRFLRMTTRCFLRK